MENTYNIWIPSMQKFVRFREIQSRHHFILYKSSIISEHELNYSFSELLKELCTDSSIDTTLFTIIDKYIIYVYLRMICVGTIINYKFECPKCKETGNGKVTLNDFIIPFKDILDHKYLQTVSVPGFEFICHIPTIQKELKTSLWLQENDIIISDINNAPTQNTLNIMNHIQEIIIQGQPLNFSKRNINEQIEIVKNIPTFYISEISHKFIYPIVNRLSNSDVVHTDCPNKKCEHVIKIPLQSINEILKFILVDEPDEYLSNILQLAEHYHISPEYINSKSLMEINMYKKYIEKLNKKSSGNEQQQQFNL